MQDKCPDKSYLILEGRESIGGTWDLFRYPGIRSDSDMYTLGYNYKQGYLPEFNGRDSFRGETVHPQHWPEDLNCATH